MDTRKKIWATDEQIAHMDYVFKEAARTDKMLPPLTKKKISNSWLDIPPDWTSYGWDKTAKVRLSPSRNQIDNYDKALETGFESPWLVIAKANALLELERFVDAQNLLNHFKNSVHEQHALAAMEQMLDALSGDVEVELVVRSAVRFKAKGDLDAAQDLLVKALLQDHSCVVYEEALQQLLIERGEKNPTLQAFELFLGEAEKMQTAALISGQ